MVIVRKRLNEVNFCTTGGHKSEIMNTPDHFKLNKISHKDRLINLCVLLGRMSCTIHIELPSNSNAGKVLTAHTTPAVNTENDEMLIEVNKHYVTLVNKESVSKWYIATCTEVNEDADTYGMCHLHCVNKYSNLKWSHPNTPDLEHMFFESIVICSIYADWDLSNERNLVLTLKNHEFIENIVTNL